MKSGVCSYTDSSFSLPRKKNESRIMERQEIFYMEEDD